MSIKYGFRIVHIDNLPHILKHGFVTAASPFASKNYTPIGDTSIIAVRSNDEVQGYRLSDYIPFYFGPRSPMLYVIQHGYNGVKKQHPSNIVYCVVLLEELIRDNIPCVFTDGHAIANFTTFYDGRRLTEVNKLISPQDVYANDWTVDPDMKRRKEAELLIKSSLAPQYIRGFCVYDEEAARKLIAYGIPAAKIVVRTDYYF